MALEVIPALDVAGGRLVRISSTGPEPIDAFGGDPIAAATAFVEAGAARLHLVDVDMAHTGEVENLPVASTMAALGARLQAGGGVATTSQVDALLSAGAERVVLGSAALSVRHEAERIVKEFDERLVVGVEADGPTIRPRGRGDELPLWDTLVWLTGLGVRRYLFTEIARVGALNGPDLDGIWAFATHVAKPVIAAGGIRSVEDLRAVAGLGENVEAAIVGRALYEGLNVREALSAGGERRAGA